MTDIFFVFLAFKIDCLTVFMNSHEYINYLVHYKYVIINLTMNMISIFL